MLLIEASGFLMGRNVYSHCTLGPLSSGSSAPSSRVVHWLVLSLSPSSPWKSTSEPSSSWSSTIGAPSMLSSTPATMFTSAFSPAISTVEREHWCFSSFDCCQTCFAGGIRQTEMKECMAWKIPWRCVHWQQHEARRMTMTTTIKKSKCISMDSNMKQGRCQL